MTASLQLLHQVRLDTVLGTAAYNIPLGSLVVVGQKVYIAPQYRGPDTPARRWPWST